MRTLAIFLALVSGFCTSCTTTEHQRTAARLAMLREQGERLLLTAEDQVAIERLVAANGEVMIVLVERLSPAKIKVVSRKSSGSYPIFEDVFVYERGVWKVDSDSVMLLEPLGRKNRPNQRPDGTSAKTPPSNPSQGAAVPHP